MKQCGSAPMPMKRSSRNWRDSASGLTPTASGSLACSVNAAGDSRCAERRGAAAGGGRLQRARTRSGILDRADPRPDGQPRSAGGRSARMPTRGLSKPTGIASESGDAQGQARTGRLRGEYRAGVGLAEQALPPGSAPWQLVTLPATATDGRKSCPVTFKRPSGRSVQQQVAIDPLAKGEYSLKTRILDLVEQMVTAQDSRRLRGFSFPIRSATQAGLLREDGAPGELFLPWRTTALVLSPDGIPRRNPSPGRQPEPDFSPRRRGHHGPLEQQYPPRRHSTWARKCEQVDLWGVQTVPREEGDWQVIEADRFPCLSPGWTRASSAGGRSSPSTSRRSPSFSRQRSTRAVRSATPSTRCRHGGWPVRRCGECRRRRSPSGWRRSEEPSAFRIRLPQDDHRRPRRALAVEIQGDEPLRFSSFRQMYVGLGHIRLETRTRLNERGAGVEQQLIERHRQADQLSMLPLCSRSPAAFNSTTSSKPATATCSTSACGHRGLIGRR